MIIIASKEAILENYTIEDFLNESDFNPKVEVASSTVGDLVSDVLMGRCRPQDDNDD